MPTFCGIYAIVNVTRAGLDRTIVSVRNSSCHQPLIPRTALEEKADSSPLQDQQTASRDATTARGTTQGSCATATKRVVRTVNQC